MAKATSIEVGVKLTIPDETVARCLRILEMWMDDHPDKDIVCDRMEQDDGTFKHELSIEESTDIEDFPTE